MASTSVLCLFTFMAMLCIVYAVEECTVEEMAAMNKCAEEYAPTEAELAAMADESNESNAIFCEGLKKSSVCFPPCYCDGLAGSIAFGIATAGCEGSNIKCGSAATLLASPLLLMLSGLIGAGIL